MRKILLATTALVAFAGAAQAAEKSPIAVTLGGDVDFRAALFHESEASNVGSSARRGGDFMTEYNLSVAAEGKAVGGIEYGSLISLTNDPADAGSNSIAMKQAYVWMSGAFGKVLMGDEQGASDLFVYAPTVGEGQIDGSYTMFTDSASLAQFQPIFVDGTENNTKVTYYTPKVGNANHKVQLGVSYAPSLVSKGTDASLYKNQSLYNDAIEATAQYTGTFSPVSVVVSPMLVTAEGGENAAGSELRTFTAWGLGAQAMYAGFTLGSSYVDAGHFNSFKGDADRDSNVWTLGLKYEFDKVAVAANYMDGEGYQAINSIATNVEDFSALGLGATYTWFPGLTTAADAVFFDQDTGAASNNIGHVLMLSQKMTF